jgi:hypothetical protein
MREAVQRNVRRFHAGDRPRAERCVVSVLSRRYLSRPTAVPVEDAARTASPDDGPKAVGNGHGRASSRRDADVGGPAK